MNKISSRDIRVFVAGALALTGFRALVLIPSNFASSMDVAHIGRAVVFGLFAGLALPIGIGIFFRRWSAFFWAQIYLWLEFISGCVLIPYLWHFSHEKLGPLALSLLPGMLSAAALLGLIFWTTSERFRYEPDA